MVDSWARYFYDFVSNCLWRLRPFLGSSVSRPVDNLFVYIDFISIFLDTLWLGVYLRLQFFCPIYSASYRLHVYYNCYDLERLCYSNTHYFTQDIKAFFYFFLWTYSFFKENKLNTNLVTVRGSWRLVHSHCDSYILHRDIYYIIYYISYEIFTANELLTGSLLRQLPILVLYA